jgi:hypothetical protein
LPHNAALKPGTGLLILILVITLLAGCMPQRADSTPTLANATSQPSPTLPAVTETPRSADPTPSPTPLVISLWVSPDLPSDFQEALQLPRHFMFSEQREAANLWLETAADPLTDGEIFTHWVYALAAPFPTLVDTQSTSKRCKMHGAGR